VRAKDEATARALIAAAYDEPRELEFRFVEQQPAGWSPYGDRFRSASWMQWQSDNE
jgi:hypothetical protein